VKDKKGEPNTLFLKNATDTKIRRHVKIKSEATPFNPLYKEYLKQCEEERKRRKTIINYESSAGLRTIQRLLLRRGRFECSGLSTQQQAGAISLFPL
jgi:RNA-directed DNA polymerase